MSLVCAGRRGEGGEAAWPTDLLSPSRCPLAPGPPPSLTGTRSPPESGGTLVLVSQDGIQRPPLHFPQGGHLLSFLSCLESGLLPRGQLEPPLWTQQGKVSPGEGGRDWVLSCPPQPRSPILLPMELFTAAWGSPASDPTQGRLTTHPTPPRQGKVFPRLRKRSSLRSVDAEDVSTGRATDYVFRIIYPGHRHEHSECLKPRSGGRERRAPGGGGAGSPGARVGGGRQGPLPGPG